MPAPVSGRQRILGVAAELFYRDGIRAVGVDAIAEAAGVAKTTLYYHFPSKDDLVLAYLEYHDATFREWLDAALTRHPGEPREQLRDVFAALAELVASQTCLGCPFLHVAAEYSDLGHAGHQIAIQHKRAIAARLAALAGQAGLREPEILAEHLMLLMDGAFASRRLYGPTGPARHVAAAAEKLLTASP